MKQLLLLLTLALTVSAADVTGKWSGSILFSGDDGSTREHRAAADLIQSGETVSGTIGPPEGQVKISAGKIAPDKLTLEAEPPDGGVATFELALKDDRLTGSVVVKQGDRTRRGTLNLTRD